MGVYFKNKLAYKFYYTVDNKDNIALSSGKSEFKVQSLRTFL